MVLDSSGLLLNRLETATALGIDLSKVVLPQQFPTWNDGDGWNQPGHYQTIQLADIDGDHQAELIGRGAKGLQVHHWNKTTHVWEELSVEGPLKDADGWNRPEDYSTIQLADIDGDGRAELIARNRFGIGTFRWQSDSASWHQIGQTPQLMGPGWAEPQHNTSLQLSDIDFDGCDELVARGPDGFSTWRWDGTTWIRLNLDNSIFGDKWAAPQYYSTIRLADVDGDGQAEVVGRAANGLQVYHWNKTSHTWEALSLEGPFGDASGGDKPEHYRTIQFGYLLGGQPKGACVMARGPDSLEAFEFIPSSDGQPAQWGIRAATPHFNANDGWDKPERYMTIQYADIDGDGRAELVARGSKGLEAWRRPFAENSWTQITADSGVMTDDEGWGEPQSYLTIQAADVDGDGKLELVGRGSDGIQTWKWGTTAEAPSTEAGAPAAQTPVIGFRTTAVDGFYQPTVTGFPDYSNNPGQLRSYEQISQYLLMLDPIWPPNGADPAEKDIRRQYINTLESSWQSFADKVADLKGKEPSGVSPGDFENVRHQIELELRFVNYAYVWFGNIRTLLKELFDEGAMSVPVVAAFLEMPPPNDNQAEVWLNWLSLVAAFVTAITMLVVVFFAPEAVPIIAACGSIISTTFRVGAMAAGGNGGGITLSTQVAQLQRELLAGRERRVGRQRSDPDCISAALGSTEGARPAD